MAKIITFQDDKHKKLMWMEVHSYSAKCKSQAGNMNQRHNDNIEVPKVMYLSMRMHLKSCYNFT